MEKIGRYEIVSRHGSGAMGIVYQARDPLMERDVAIKVMTEASLLDPELKKRFYREARSAAKVEHKNIVRIYDMGEDKGMPFIVMELLKGKDLRKLLKEKTSLSVEKKLDIIIQVCRGLAHAHNKGIVHRDIKPENIFLLEDGEAKIMDFGIAKITATDMTRTGVVMGTVDYMSPEQISGKKVDARSDIFSVGSTFFELLTGKRPFAGDSMTAVMYKIVHEQPETFEIHGFEDESLAKLRDIILNALEKDIDGRYQKISQMADDLEEILRNRTEAAIAQHLKSGRDYLQEKKYYQAIAAFECALELNPHHVEAKRLITRARKEKEEEEKQKFIISKLGEGKDFRDKKHFDESLEVLKEILEIDSKNAEVIQLIKEVKEEIKRLEAERNINKNIKLGRELFSTKKYEEALHAFREVLSIDANHAEASSFVEKLNEAIEQERKDAQVAELTYKAKQLLSQNDYNNSLKVLEKILEIAPDHKATLALIKKVNSEKESELKSEVKENLILGEKHLKEGDYHTAIECLTTTLVLDPNHSKAKQMLDSAKSRLEEIAAEEAARAEKERELNSKIKENLRLGEKCTNTGDHQRAIEHFELVLTIDPDNSKAIQSIEAAKSRLAEVATQETVIADADSMETRVIPSAPETVVLPPKVVPVGKKRKRKPSYVASAIAAVIIIGAVAAFYAYYKNSIDSTSHAGSSGPVSDVAEDFEGEIGFVRLNILPWAEVVRIKHVRDDEHGSVKTELPLQKKIITPYYLSLPEGHYDIELQNPGFESPLVLTINVKGGEIQEIIEEIPGFDPKKVAEVF